VESAPGNSRRDRTHKQRLQRLESLICEQHWPPASVAVDPARCAAAGPGSRRNTAAAKRSRPATSEATEEVCRITPRKTAEPLHGPPRRTQERRRDTESSRPLRPADVGLDY